MPAGKRNCQQTPNYAAFTTRRIRRKRNLRGRTDNLSRVTPLNRLKTRSLAPWTRLLANGQDLRRDRAVIRVSRIIGKRKRGENVARVGSKRRNERSTNEERVTTAAESHLQVYQNRMGTHRTPRPTASLATAKAILKTARRSESQRTFTAETIIDINLNEGR